MSNSRMLQETLEISDRVNHALVADLSALPKAPNHLYSIARGSSAHAALVIQQLLAGAGVPATSMQPSYLNRPVTLLDSLVLIVSQSGASPDLIRAAEQSQRKNCPTLSLVNHSDSGLEAITNYSLHQHAGTELAVAATKSAVCSIVMGARLAEYWGGPSLDLLELPEQIKTVQSQSIDALISLFIGEGPILIIGRYAGYGIACEIALKIQELLGRPAMAYTSSEVLHGPAGMLVADFPVLALTMGPEHDDVAQCVESISKFGARCTCVEMRLRNDPLASTVFLTQCYVALEAACQKLGRSADNPNNLGKVTLTD